MVGTGGGSDGQGGSGYAGGGVASPSASSKVGLYIAIGVGVLIVAGAIWKFAF